MAGNCLVAHSETILSVLTFYPLYLWLSKKLVNKLLDKVSAFLGISNSRYLN